MEKIIKLIQEGNSPKSLSKDIDCFLLIGSKIWCKYERNGKATKRKHTGRPQKISKRPNRKLHEIYLEKKNILDKANEK